MTERAALFLEMLHDKAGNVNAACRGFGINRSAVQYWRRMMPDFAEREREIRAGVSIAARAEELAVKAAPALTSPLAEKPSVPVKDPAGRFIQVWRETLERAEAARESGMTIGEAKRLKKKDPLFAKAYNEVWEEIEVRLEDTLVMKGVLKHDTAAAANVLRAKNPEYKARLQVNGGLDLAIHAGQVQEVKEGWLASFRHGPQVGGRRALPEIIEGEVA